MSPVRRLWSYAWPYRGRLAGALLAMALFGAASAGLAYLIKPIFDDVLPNRQRLDVVAAALLGCYLLKGIGAYASTYLMTGVGQRVVMTVRNDLFRHIVGQSAGFFTSRTTGRLMSRITNDVHQIQLAVSVTIGDLLREALTLAGFGGLLFYYDPGLALVCLTGAPVVVYPLIRLGQRVRRTSRRSQEELEHLSHITAEAFTGHRIVKAFGAEAHEVGKFSAASTRLFRTNMKVTGAIAALPPLMEFLGGFAVAGALWYGSREIAASRLTSGEFASFIAALFMMYGPVKKLSRVTAGLQQAAAAAERIFETLDVHTEVLDRPNAAPAAPLRHSIAFRDVGFSYQGAGGQLVLRHVSLMVRAGQMVALVGLSGSGKTTLVNLLARFYDVTEGAIMLDGVDIPGCDGAVAAKPDRDGHPGDHPLRRHSRREHRLWLGLRVSRGDRGCGARGTCARLHRGAARRLRHAGRRARPATVGGAASAAGDCSSLAGPCANLDSGRGDLVTGFGVRGARPGCAGHVAGEPHVIRDRAPAVNGAASRCDRRARRGPGC